MPREMQDYRDILQRITQKFDKETLTIKEASQFTGIPTERLKTVKDSPVKKVGGRYYVPIVALARWLCLR